MKKVDFLLKLFIAHRGYFNNKNIPENSIPSFKKAINNNYAIELDVHITKDNKLVVFHDYNLKRMCNINKKVEDLTYKELLRYNLLDTKCKIPLLEEVLVVVDNKVPLIIEVKTKEKNRIEKYMVKLLDNYNGDFAIQSFNPYVVYWFKKHRKNYIRGILTGNFNSKNNKLKEVIMKSLILNYILKVDFISFDIRSLPNKKISKYRKNKIIIGWNIKTKKEYNFAKKYCDNMIGENMNEYLKEF